MELTITNFISYVGQYLSGNIHDIKSTWTQQGGWEGWLQAEICNYINAKGKYTILREEAVYASGQKADFLLNAMSPPTHQIVAELKCQSLGNWENFVSGLEHDAEKLSGPLKEKYKGARALAIGIYFTHDGGIPEHFKWQDLKDEVGICWRVL
jgi:hypothetical protein